MKISSKRSNPFSHPWKISPSKKKKLISRLWKSRPRTNFRISFLGEDSKPQSRAAESAQLSRAFLFLCTFPSLPTRASLRSPTRASEAPFLRRVVRSQHSVWWEDERGDRDPLAQIPRTLPFFYIWNIIKRGKRGGNRLRSSSECPALVTNGRWTDSAMWPEMRLESYVFFNVNRVRSISFNLSLSCFFHRSHRCNSFFLRIYFSPSRRNFLRRYEAHKFLWLIDFW